MRGCVTFGTIGMRVCVMSIAWLRNCVVSIVQYGRVWGCEYRKMRSCGVVSIEREGVVLRV